MHIRIHYHF